MREAGIAVRTLADLARQEIVRLARPSPRGRGVALALNAGPGDGKDGPRDAAPVHRLKTRVAEIGQARQDAARHFGIDVVDGRPPILFQAGAQEVLLEGNLAHHIFPRLCLR